MRVANIFSPVAAAALSLLFLPSCSQKEEIVEPETYTVEFTAIKGSAQTRALEVKEDGYLGAPWEEGETVSVFRINPNAQTAEEVYQNVGTLTAQSSGYTTTLKGRLTGTYSVGENLTFSYKHGFKSDYREQDGTLEKIASDYDYAFANCEVFGIDSDAHTLTISSSLQFDSQQDIFKFTLKDTTGIELEASKLVLQATAIILDQNGQQVESEGLVQYYDPTQMGLYLGPIEVIPSNNTSVFYVALCGAPQYYGYGPTGTLHNARFVMTATVGKDTYVYSSDDFSFFSDHYYVYDVIMIKQE